MGQLDNYTLNLAQRDFEKNECKCSPKGYDCQKVLICDAYICDNSGCCCCDCHSSPEMIAAEKTWRERQSHSQNQSKGLIVKVLNLIGIKI